MSKSIYDDALQEIRKVWNGNPLTYPKKTIKALERAKKQEKLLDLYKQLVNENLQINLSVLEKIKEIENDK